MGISRDEFEHEATSKEPAVDSLATSGNLSTQPKAHVVLFQPEIPQNTGNIGRSCVAFQAKLWIVRPTGFRLDEKSVRRAGLDYWQHLNWQDVAHWEELTECLKPRRFWYFSRFGTRNFWDADFALDDVLVFGRETSGLPPSIMEQAGSHLLRVDTPGPVRSLNLGTTVGIVLAEFSRQVRTLPP